MPRLNRIEDSPAVAKASFDSEEDSSFYSDAEDVSSLDNVTGGGEEESCKLCAVVIKSAEEDNTV